jgi:KTSC domain
MPRTPVVSSSIHGVGYDPDAQTLEVEFKHGRVYQYFHVPLDVLPAFLAAESKGSFFNRHIRGHFGYRSL